MLQRVDSDGWVLLSPEEQHEYEMWTGTVNGDKLKSMNDDKLMKR